MGTQDVALTAEEWSRFGPYGHPSGLNVSSKGFRQRCSHLGQEELPFHGFLSFR